MTHSNLHQIKRQLSHDELAETTETIGREQIELAKQLETENGLSFDAALGIIERQCELVLPGYRGHEKVWAWRTLIRDPLRAGVMDECTCDTATAAGVDIPGVGGEVCDVCRRQAENKEIPY